MQNIVYIFVAGAIKYKAEIVNSLGLPVFKKKKDGKDQDSIQTSTTPDPGYGMGK